MRSFCAFIALSLIILANSQTAYFPPKIGNWEEVQPEWNTDAKNKLISFLGEKHTKAFIILIDGRMAVEHYFGEFTADSLWYWASAGKSLTAFLTGIAQDKGLLNISDPSSMYLGNGWSSLSKEQEDKIKVLHHLSMTTGLDDYAGDVDCTDPECLDYKAEPGNRWAYHNAPYTLIEKVIESASNMTYNQFTNQMIENTTGMSGLWFKLGYNNLYLSNVRTMARFGLLMLNNGIWKQDTVLHNEEYFNSMISSSQDLNPSYGYLWWLNGQSSYMTPRIQYSFSGSIVPSAPSDMYAAMGKNDQKIYVVPSKKMVVVRIGNKADSTALALSGFDNELWEHINALEESTLAKHIVQDNNSLSLQNDCLIINCLSATYNLTIYDISGNKVFEEHCKKNINTSALNRGIYIARLISDNDGSTNVLKFIK